MENTNENEYDATLAKVASEEPIFNDSDDDKKAKDDSAVICIMPFGGFCMRP
jgi:uncharacterized NAD-dependent epimerase/dehydratase family protein